MSGAKVVDAARGWIGTPYVHQASAKGAGCDCLGLLRGIWRELIGPEPEITPAYSQDWSEAQRDERLWRAAARSLAEKDCQRLNLGDVILFRMRSNSVAKHLGIVGSVGPAPSFIHSYSGHGVFESPLSDPWRRKIVAAFEFPARSY